MSADETPILAPVDEPADVEGLTEPLHGHRRTRARAGEEAALEDLLRANRGER